MQKIKDNLLSLSAMLIIPIINIFYSVLNNSNRGVYTLATGFDKGVPFLKAFIMPYIIWYPFIIISLIYMCFKNKEIYYKSVISLIISLLTSYIIFFFFQTTVARPEVLGNDIFSIMVRFIYSTDNPYNCFPSIHVITTYIIMRFMGNNEVRSKINNIIVIILGVFIILSTEFIKQHVLMDIIFAIILGEGIYTLINYYGLEMIKKCQQKKYLLLMMKKKSET